MMASVRQRKPVRASHPSGTPISSLQRELIQVHQRSLSRGLSQMEFSNCLSVAASKHVSTVSTQRSMHVRRKADKLCCSALKLCWMLFLLLVVLGLLVAFCPAFSFYIQRSLQSHLYDIIRSIRFGVLAIFPYMRASGLDILKECYVENPLFSETESCSCLRIKEATEVAMVDGLPDNVFLDRGQVYVIRNILPDEGNITLDLLQDFHKKNGKNPPACLEVGSQGGPMFYRQLFDITQMEQFLSSQNAWSFTW